MENKTPSQNIQDVYLNTVRAIKRPSPFSLISGVKLIGKIKGFDKYSVILEANNQEQLIFKHAISTVTTAKMSSAPPPPPPPLPQAARRNDRHPNGSLHWRPYGCIAAPRLSVFAQRGRTARTQEAQSGHKKHKRSSYSAFLCFLCFWICALRVPCPCRWATMPRLSKWKTQFWSATTRWMNCVSWPRLPAHASIDEVVQHRNRPDPATFIGKGKVEELREQSADRRRRRRHL